MACSRDILTIGGGVVALDDVEIVRFAEQSGVQEGELLAGRQLTRASVACEAGQMINPFSGSSHPISGAYATPAFRALRTESSAKHERRVTLTRVTASTAAGIYHLYI